MKRPWSDLPLVNSAGAGHTLRGKYRVYGEGSVHHNGHPCEHGLGLDRHPLIFRHDYDSIWHYIRSEIAMWYSHREMRRLVIPRDEDKEGKPYPMKMAKFRWSPFDRPMHKLFGPGYPRVPTVKAALRPEDSIYDRSDM